MVSIGGALFFIITAFWGGKIASNNNSKPVPWVFLFSLFFVLLRTGAEFLSTAKKYGGWDAWAIWNYHARCLAATDHWQFFLFPTLNEHGDYPLFLPSLNAFWLQVTGGQHFVYIPLITALAIGIFLVTLLYTQLAERNFLIATLGMYCV
ncbi:MAG: hypothetical protein EBZ77_12220, partial [Chitinophagia bacterium]|nr:hypothetical protein [Chitinophagia bacterium]